MIPEMIYGKDTVRVSNIPDIRFSLAFQDQGVRHRTAGPLPFMRALPVGSPFCSRPGLDHLKPHPLDKPRRPVSSMQRHRMFKCLIEEKKT